MKRFSLFGVLGLMTLLNLGACGVSDGPPPLTIAPDDRRYERFNTDCLPIVEDLTSPGSVKSSPYASVFRFKARWNPSCANMEPEGILLVGYTAHLNGTAFSVPNTLIAYDVSYATATTTQGASFTWNRAWGFTAPPLPLYPMILRSFGVDGMVPIELSPRQPEIEFSARLFTLGQEGNTVIPKLRAFKAVPKKNPPSISWSIDGTLNTDGVDLIVGPTITITP